MERIWQSLFKRKKKGRDSETQENNKENIDNSLDPEPERVTVKSSGNAVQCWNGNRLFSHITFYKCFISVVGDSKTFPRVQAQQLSVHPSPRLDRVKRDTVAVSSTSLRGHRFDDPYDKSQWVSTQHFHVPLGTRPRHASSKGALSMNSVHTSSRRHLARPVSTNSLRPTTPVIEPHNNLRRQVEPYDKIKDHGGVQHFHLPRGQAKRFLYTRSDQKGAMNKLVQSFQNQKGQSTASLNQDEPIQVKMKIA